MTLITSDGLERARKNHERKDKPCGVSGYRWAADVVKLARETGASTVLDYGAGKGTLAGCIRNLEIRNYDPVTYPDHPETADIVVCTDVLEHVENLDAVLDHIQSLARMAVFFAVPKHPKEKKKPGLTIWPLSRWDRILRERWPECCSDVVKWAPNGTPRIRFVGYAR